MTNAQVNLSVPKKGVIKNVRTEIYSHGSQQEHFHCPQLEEDLVPRKFTSEMIIFISASPGARALWLST